MNKGPSKIKVPEQEYMSCFGCAYMKSSLVVSGRHPIRAYTCAHPKAGRQHSLWNTGTLEVNADCVVETPDWCPIISKVV